VENDVNTLGFVWLHTNTPGLNGIEVEFKLTSTSIHPKLRGFGSICVQPNEPIRRDKTACGVLLYMCIKI
jgi:hypothetical protein